MRTHIAQSHRRVGRGEQQVERRLIDTPVQHQLDRAVAPLSPAADEMEGAVAPPDRLAGQADVWAGQDQTVEVEDAVRPRSRSVVRCGSPPASDRRNALSSRRTCASPRPTTRVP